MDKLFTHTICVFLSHKSSSNNIIICIRGFELSAKNIQLLNYTIMLIPSTIKTFSNQNLVDRHNKAKFRYTFQASSQNWLFQFFSSVFVTCL